MSEFDESTPHLLTDTKEGGLYLALTIIRASSKSDSDPVRRAALGDVAVKIAHKIGERQVERLRETARAAGRSRRITSDDPELVERLLVALRENGVAEFDLGLRGNHRVEIIVKHGRDVGGLDRAIDSIMRDKG